MSQQFRGTGNQFRSEDEAEIRAREINELKSEINRLECELKKANAQTEEFERRWYLTCDVVDDLEGKQSVLIDLLRECLSVLNTIDGDDCHEIECLADLELKCEKAIEGALQ